MKNEYRAIDKWIVETRVQMQQLITEFRLHLSPDIVEDKEAITQLDAIDALLYVSEEARDV